MTPSWETLLEREGNWIVVAAFIDFVTVILLFFSDQQLKALTGILNRIILGLQDPACLPFHRSWLVLTPPGSLHTELFHHADTLNVQVRGL